MESKNAREDGSGIGISHAIATPPSPPPFSSARIFSSLAIPISPIAEPHPVLNSVRSSPSTRLLSADVSDWGYASLEVKSDYAIIYIWNSRHAAGWLCSCGLSSCCRIGHTSMQLCNANGTAIDDGHISIWPATEYNPGATYKLSLKKDIEAETNGKLEEKPDKIVKITGIDVKAMYNAFKKMKTKGLEWDVLGGGLLKHKKNIMSCSGLIAELLIKHGGLEKYLSRVDPEVCFVIDDYLDSCTGYCNKFSLHETRRARDIFRVVKSQEYCKEYGKRLLRPIAPLVSIGVLIVLFQCVFSRDFPHWDDGPLAKTAIIIDVIFLIIFLYSGLYALKSSCNRITVDIGNCAGISPNDVDFLLDYLSKDKGEYNIIKLNEGDFQYHLDVPGEPLTSVENPSKIHRL